jgi:hypothetical protein
MMDLVAFIVQVCRELEGKKVTFETLFEEDSRIKKASIESIIDFSARDPYWPVPHDSTLADVAEIFYKYNVKRYKSKSDSINIRVPILNTKGEIMNLITQSALVGCIANNLDEFGTVVLCTVQELNMHRKPPVTIRDYKRALDALSAIIDNEVFLSISVVKMSRIVKRLQLLILVIRLLEELVFAILG